MKRQKYLNSIDLQYRVHPISGLLGPRQAGKTTLAQMYIEQHQSLKVHFFDLENAFDLSRLDAPMLTLSKYADCLIVIDEIQRRRELFPTLRVLVECSQNLY